MTDIHPAVRISTPRALPTRESMEGSAEQRSTTVGGWLDAVELPADTEVRQSLSEPSGVKNGSFVNYTQLEAANAAEEEQSVIHSPVENTTPKPYPATAAGNGVEGSASPPGLEQLSNNHAHSPDGNDDEVLQDGPLHGSSESGSSSSGSNSSSDSGDDDDEEEAEDSDSGSSSSGSGNSDSSSGDEEDSSSSEEDEEEEDLAAHLPKPRKQSLGRRRKSKTHHSPREDDDVAEAARHSVVPPLSLTMNPRGPLKPRPPSGDTQSQGSRNDFRRRAATAPSATAATTTAEDEILASKPSHSTSRAARGRLGAALSAARDASSDDDSDATSSDGESTSSASSASTSTTSESESETTTTSTSHLDTTSTTQTTSMETTSMTSPGSPSGIPDKDLDDDRLYAKLVGISSDSSPMSPQDVVSGGVRERRLRTLLGNVWRQSRASRRASPAAKLQEDAVRDLLKILTRDRHQYREAARREREHRREALEAAEKAQRVVDGLIARGLSRGASGTAALVNNLPGSEPIEIRSAKKKERRRSSARSATATEGDAASTSSKSGKHRKSRSKKDAAPSLSLSPAESAATTTTVDTETPKKKRRSSSSSSARRLSTPADKKMTATMPAATAAPHQLAGDLVGNTPRPLRQKAGVVSLDAKALQQLAPPVPCTACAVDYIALQKQVALLQAENEMLRARQQMAEPAGTPASPTGLKPDQPHGVIADGEKTMPAKRVSKKKKSPETLTTAPGVASATE